jgi:hypothetical protein
VGDTNLDFKWRFYGAAPWSLGVRAGLEDANLGYSRMPEYLGARTDLMHFSLAAMYALNERAFLVLDTAVDSNPDSRQSLPPAVALLGVIYTVRPGFDLDVGYRGRLNTAAPIRQFLLGITYRGAL